MLTISAPNSSSIFRVMELPFKKARDFPARWMRRLTSNPCDWSTARRSRIWGPSSSPSSKKASTEASSWPVRIISAEARSPIRRLMASTRMDLPAPVSPVRTLRPAPNSARSWSMIAKFLMFSSESTSHEEIDGIDEDGFAGAGLAGEDIEAGPEFGTELVDDRKIFDVQLGKHFP